MDSRNRESKGKEVRLLRFVFVKRFGTEFAFHAGNRQSCRRVTDHVDGRTDHVENTVNTSNQTDHFKRNTDLRKDQSRHNQTRTRNTGSTDSSQHAGDKVSGKP